MFVRLSHLLNAESATTLHPSFITQLVMSVDFAFMRTTYGLLPFPKYNPLSYSLYFRLPQYLNASPIEVTPLPIVTLVSMSQKPNASLPIEVTLSGIVTLVNLPL